MEVVNKSSIKNSNKRIVLCKFGCNTQIMFDKQKVGKNGKLIPLNHDGSIHNCSNRNQNVRRCRYCQGDIIFDDNITHSISKKRIPLNLNHTYHDCSLNPYNTARREQNQRYQHGS